MFDEDFRDGPQKYPVIVLGAAMICELLGIFFPWIKYISGILLLVFFVWESFLLTGVGLILMSVFMSLLFLILPTVSAFLLGMITGSLILLVAAAVICFLLSGTIITIAYGAIISVQTVIITAPLTMASGVTAAAVGAGMAAGVGLQGAIGAATDRYASQKSGVVKTLRNLLVVLLICWPVLSYTGAVNGAIACKPAAIAGRAHKVHLNIGSVNYFKDYFENYETADNFAFGSNFYHQYIRGTNNDLTQGTRNRIAGNDRYTAILLHGLLYVRDEKKDDTIFDSAYLPKKTDAMVLQDNAVFIFGKNKIFVCTSAGEYTWKNTKYITEFEKLSWEEQCEYLYEILERQNTEDAQLFSFEEVGIVACAQRNGLLLNYNRLTHTALFTQQKNGRVTVFAQDSAGVRREQVTFRPNKPTQGQTWVMAGADGILYLKEDKVKFLSAADQWAEFEPFANPEKNMDFQTVHYGWVGEDEDIYSVYGDAKKLHLDVRNVAGNVVKPVTLHSKQMVAGFAGNRFYSLQYKDNLISRLTFIQDVRDHYGPHEVRSEIYTLQFVELNKETFQE